MFRNVESHFSQVPRVQAGRSVFMRPCTHKTSGDCGRLYPIYTDIVYPGDTVSMKTSKVIRLQTMLTPIMDNVYADTYWFFVPMRLIWDHWKEFMGENTASAWIPEVTYTIPTIAAPTSTGFSVGTLADHMGLPTGVAWKATDKHAPMALPFRAYALICNEFFRDQNVTDPLNIPTGDSNQTGTNGDSYINDVANGGMPFKVARYHDFWSSMLPGPQKGPDVGFTVTPQLNILGNPPVSGNAYQAPSGSRNVYHLPLTNSSGLVFSHIESNEEVYRDINIHDGTSSLPWYAAHNLITKTDNTLSGFKDGTDSWQSVEPVNLWTLVNPANMNLTANLENMISLTGVSAFNINELRLAFQLQKYYEQLARSGSRYTEVIKAMFNITSPDGRIQRPEYLGGNRVSINIHEVTNQAQTEADFLGDLGAKAHTADIHSDFVKSFTEHGVLLGLMCLRTDRSYAQGYEPFWSRLNTTDWYFPQFANIGEQPCPTAHLYATTTTMNSDDVFGYQEAWADMRYKPNYVTGEMRPGISNTLASWHLSDYYTSKPTLSDGWMREGTANLDRCLAVTSAVSNQFFADIYFDSKWTRVLPMYSVPGLIDHH